MATYDKHYREPDYFGEPYPGLMAFFKKHTPKGHVLDLGCGQGRDSIPIARMGYRVTGVDVSKVGISQMQAAVDMEKLDLTGVVADMYGYTVDDSVDVVLLDSMLHFYPKDRGKGDEFPYENHERATCGWLFVCNRLEVQENRKRAGNHT